MLTGSFPGMWWLPGDEGAQRCGVLSLAYDNLSLDLVGSFGQLQEMGKIHAYPVVHGTSTDGKFFTLVNALVGNEALNTRAIDIRATQLRPGSVLVGRHLEDPVGATWAVAAIELERMTAWASPVGFEREFELTEDRHAKAFTFRYTVPEPVEASIPGAELLIGPGQQTIGDLLHEAGLRVAVESLFIFDTPAPIDEISQRYLNPLHNLVILATQKPTALVSMRVAWTDAKPREWVEVVQRRNAPDVTPPKRLFPTDALFLLPDLLEADPAGLRRWFEAAAVLLRPFELVAAVRSTPRLFLDHRFINVATAAESYHLERVGGRAISDEIWEEVVRSATDAASDELAGTIRNRMATLKNPSFRDRIESLLDRGGEPLRSLLPDATGLAKRAGDIRNPLAHGSRSVKSWREIFDTTDELLLVLEFHFLREAGFSAEEAAVRLREASRSYSGLWLRKREDEAHRTPGAGALD